MPSIDPTSPERLHALLREADAILIALGRGFTQLADFDPFTAPSWFRSGFRDLIERHGLRTIASGLAFAYPSSVMAWAFHARLIQQACFNLAPKELIARVLTLANRMPSFLFTTNLDGWFRTAGFSEKRLFEMGGSLARMNCRWGCCAASYPTGPAVRKMLAAGRRACVPPELLPRCPRCGGPMAPVLVRGAASALRTEWPDEGNRLRTFLKAHRDERLLILELGVSPWNAAVKGITTHALRACPRSTWLIAHSDPGWRPPDLYDRIIFCRSGIPQVLAGLMEG